MANLMKREGELPQLWICLAIYTSVVLAHGAPLALSGGDSDECSCSNLDPLLFIAGEIALECNCEIWVVRHKIESACFIGSLPPVAKGLCSLHSPAEMALFTSDFYWSPVQVHLGE